MFVKQIEQDIADDFFRTPSSTVEKYADADLAARWKARRDAKEAVRREREQAEREKREAEKRAIETARAKEEQERRDWIAAHGSPRLRRLVKENIEHKAVYRDERLAADRPGWMWADKDDDFEEARNAPEAALDLIDKARETIPGQAVWLRYVVSRDEETGEERRSYAALGQFYEALHARIPMVTPDEQRAIQEENAKDDERLWGALRDMNAASVDEHKQLIAKAEAKVAEHGRSAAEAAEKANAAQNRLERLKRGESVAGGFGKPLTREDCEAALKAAGMTAMASLPIGRAAMVAESQGLGVGLRQPAGLLAASADRALMRRLASYAASVAWPALARR